VDWTASGDGVVVSMGAAPDEEADGDGTSVGTAASDGDGSVGAGALALVDASLLGGAAVSANAMFWPEKTMSPASSPLTTLVDDRPTKEPKKFPVLDMPSYPLLIDPHLRYAPASPDDAAAPREHGGETECVRSGNR
jgi:hypothetical protein